MTNPLDGIMAWYTTAHDAHRVTRRVIEKATPKIITKKYVFHGKAQSENEADLDRAIEELNRLVILALTAIFERTLRDHLCALPVIASPSGNPHHDAVRSEILKDVEFWNISSRVLDLFATVDGTLRGEVKQIIDYRNWVAHGRTSAGPPPVVMTPAKAHLRLTAFLTQAKVI
jgi:hypothetical protein